VKRIAIGLLGPTLDNGFGPERWNKWRPSVALCQQDDLAFDRFELLHQLNFSKLAKLVCEDVRVASPETAIQLHEVRMRDPWDFEEVYGALYDFAHVYPFDPEREEYYVHITTGTHVAQICLFLLVEAPHIPARLIQTRPAKRAAEGYRGGTSVIDLDLSKYDKLAARFERAVADDLSFLKSGIATRSPQFNRLIEQIERVALRSVEPVLLTGPTGSGKSRLARRLYELKKVRGLLQEAAPFVEVNCATLRGDTAMSTLFGHRKGAFTGAVQDREGLLRSAAGGLLFLDEIGELGLDEQALLLRAIEERRFFPLGADAEVESDFQLVCGSNRDLREAVAAGRFRADLLARIQLWTFRLPGLRERPEDIEPNLDYELDRFAQRSGRRVTFNKDARACFLAFADSAGALWQANFRDLNSAVVRMATLAPGGRIGSATVAEEIERLREGWGRPGAAAGTADADTALLTGLLGAEGVAALDRFDRLQLAGVVRVCRNSPSLSAAGRELFAASRLQKATANDADRLRKYLARFSLAWGAVRAERGP
jgi:transcriptional regulatory protein RtcR